MGLQAQAQVKTRYLPLSNRDAVSPKLPAFLDEKDELDSYLLRLKCYTKNANCEQNTWAIQLSALSA